MFDPIAKSLESWWKVVEDRQQVTSEVKEMNRCCSGKRCKRKENGSKSGLRFQKKGTFQQSSRGTGRILGGEGHFVLLLHTIQADAPLMARSTPAPGAGRLLNRWLYATSSLHSED